MKAFDNFTLIMGRILEILPRYIELAEKSNKTYDENVEMENYIDKIDRLKDEILKIMPELNISLSDSFFNNYNKMKSFSENPDLFMKNKADESSKFSQMPISDFLKNSLN